MQPAGRNSQVSKITARVPPKMPQTPELGTRRMQPIFPNPNLSEENKPRRSVHFNDSIVICEITDNMPSQTDSAMYNKPIISQSSESLIYDDESMSMEPFEKTPPNSMSKHPRLSVLLEPVHTSWSPQQAITHDNDISFNEISMLRACNKALTTQVAQYMKSEKEMKNQFKGSMTKANEENVKLQKLISMMETSMQDLQIDRNREHVARLDTEKEVENLQDNLASLKAELDHTKTALKEFQNAQMDSDIKTVYIKSEIVEPETNANEILVAELRNEITQLRDHIAELERTQLETSVIFPAPIPAAQNMNQAIELTLGPIRAEYQAKCDQFIVEKVQLQAQLNDAVDRARRTKTVLAQVRAQRNELREKLAEAVSGKRSAENEVKLNDDNEDSDIEVPTCNCAKKSHEDKIRSLVIEQMLNGQIKEILGLNVAQIDEKVRNFVGRTSI